MNFIIEKRIQLINMVCLSTLIDIFGGKKNVSSIYEIEIDKKCKWCFDHLQQQSLTLGTLSTIKKVLIRTTVFTYCMYLSRRFI